LSSDSTVVEGCTFVGYGYAGGIGDWGTYIHSMTGQGNIVVKDCTFKVTAAAGAISGETPLTGMKSYFWISESEATVTVDNCVFTCRDSDWQGDTDVIDATLLTGDKFNKFIYLSGDLVNVTNSSFNGPVQSYNDGATGNLAIPTLYLNSGYSVLVESCRFYSGALPLQISGSGLLDSSVVTNPQGIRILSSDFMSISATVTQALVDIDIDNSNYDLTSLTAPQIVIDGNNFNQFDTSSTAYVKHENATGAWYDTNGIVQVYAPGCDVHVSNNMVFGYLAMVGSPSDYGKYAGIFVDNYNGTDSNYEETPRSIIVTGNSISVTNDSTTWTGATSLSAVECIGSVVNISDNRVNFHNASAPTITFAGCLNIATIPTTGSLYSDGIISNNIFSRHDPADGYAESLVGGYITIDSASGKGMFIDNSFDQNTYQGSAETLVDDNTSAVDNWIIERNKKQTDLMTLYASLHGIVTIDGGRGAVVVGTPQDVAPAAMDSYVAAATATPTLTYYYEDTNDGITATWEIPLRSVIPDGAFLVSVEADVTVDVQPATTSLATLSVISSAGTDTDTENPLTTSGEVLELGEGKATSLTYEHRALPGSDARILLSYQAKGVAAVVFTSKPIAVEYRW
jgi:hypothetical protein